MESSPDLKGRHEERDVALWCPPMLALILAACDPVAEAPPLEVTVTQSPVNPTVYHVTWTTEEPGIGWVVFGRDSEEKLETFAETVETTDHDILVAGLSPATEWLLRAHARVGEAELQSDPMPVKPGNLAPSGMSVAGVEGRLHSARWVLQGILGNGEGWTIFDDRGIPVWSMTHDYERMTARGRLTPDGTTLLVGDFNVDNAEPDYGYIRRFVLDGTELESVPTPNAHHDFVPTPGGYAFLALDVRSVNDLSVVGDQLIEVDASGTELARPWSTFDSWSAEGASEPDPFYRQGLDWTHANTLDYDAATDEYVVSVRNLSAIVRISRATGAVVEQFGGPTPTYTLTGGTAFEAQHSPLFVGPDTLLVLDNTFRDVSAVREYALDPAAKTYAESWHYQTPSKSNVPVLGDLDRDAEGRTLVSWGAAGALQELSSTADQTFELDLSLGAAFSFFEPLDQIGGPAPR